MAQAPPLPPPSAPREHAAGRRAATVVLALVALGLACAMGLVGLPAPSVAIAPDLREYPRYEGTRFKKTVLAPPGDTDVMVTHVQILDFDEDGLNDVLVCDAARSSVLCYQQSPAGVWKEIELGRELPVPAHATVVDLDQDGDHDVVVSVLGNIRPADDLVGKVVLLENTGSGFTPRVLLDDLRRVADAQPGDFDGDGDLDLAVAVFGYARGEVLWLENRGGLHFRDHQLLFKPGTIHVPVGDLDGDGDLDIAAVVSQDEEEVWAFENLGQGRFQRRRLYFTNNFDAGSAGLVAADLDQDNDLDLLLPQGDNLEDGLAIWPQPYHGCLWLENQGAWRFQARRIGQLGLTYAADAGDVDGDGRLDVVLAALTDDLNNPANASLVWLRQATGHGRREFAAFKIDHTPTKLITVACGDLNGDGRADVVAGSLHLAPFRDRQVQRVTAWLSQEAPP